MAIDVEQTTQELSPVADRLDRAIRARHTVIAVNTHEEERFLRLLRIVADLQNKVAVVRGRKQKPIFLWSRIRGLRREDPVTHFPDDKPIPETEDPAGVLDEIAKHDSGYFVLCDFAPYLAPYGQEDPVLVRQLRELAITLKGTTATVLIVGPSMPEVPTLEKEIRPIDLPLPEEAELAAILDQRMVALEDAEVTVDVAGDARNQLIGSLLGLTEAEADGAIASAVVAHRALSVEVIPTILDEKAELVRRSGSLTYTPAQPEWSIGGYANLHRLLHQAAVTFKPEAQAFGVEPSKGVLLVGLPGTGKDATKKVASNILGRPLLDLDMGSVMGEGGGILGQAEMSIKRALAIADVVKPVLGVTEFEKGFSGSESSGRTDGGTTSRIMSTVLNWLQEQTGTFVFATANDVRSLPPELIRQGRFGQVVFVDLPSEEDRAAIFAVHLRKRQRDPEAFNLGLMAEMARDFSGAEIEAAVKGGLLDAYMEGTELGTDHVCRRVATTKPLAHIRAREINELREWAATNLAVSATEVTAHGPLTVERNLEL